MVDQSCSGRGRRFLLRLVDLVHDGVEAAMAFDGVPIDISDGLPEPRRFCLGRCRVSGCLVGTSLLKINNTSMTPVI